MFTGGKNKASDAMRATVQTRQGIGGGMKSHGSWLTRCHGPLLIADQPKFESIIQRQGLIVPTFAAAGVLHLSAWDRIRETLHSRFRPALDELESLLSGGKLLWEDQWENLVVNVGLDDVLDKYFKGSAYTAAHYIGLTDGAPVTVAAGDTMASHAGWSEVTTYSETVRQTYNNSAAVSGQSHSNSGNPAQFSINGTVTVGGGFLTTSNVKGGSVGTLYSAGAFTGGDKSLGNGDTLSVTATFTQADDGV